MANVFANYNSAYINYISSKVTYSFVILAAEIGYFVAESIANEAITKWFE